MNDKKFVSVKSSVVKEVYYDEKTGELQICFNNSSLYSYKDVPKSVYKEFISTSSKGAFITKSIAKNYAYKKL